MVPQSNNQQLDNSIYSESIISLNPLKEYRTNNAENLIVASLNVNSIRNKFDQLKLLVKDSLDILVLEETKLDETFPEGQFYIDGFMPPFRRDRNQYGGGVMIFVRDSIPAKVLDIDLPNDIESIFVELNFNNNKWLLMGTYRPPTQCSKKYYSEISKVLDQFSLVYDNVLLTGDFNEETTQVNTKSFLESYDLSNLVKNPTCYKSLTNPSCIDLFLTNKKLSFKHTTTIDMGISDFHRMIVTSFKFKYAPGTPKIVHYRSFKKFDKNLFQKELRQLTKSDNNFNFFDDHYLTVLEKHAPMKQKTLRANEAPYMSKALRKAMMRRTELANKYHKSNTEYDYLRFRKHRNYVNRLYKRERKFYFNNLKKNDIEDVRKFWKTVKPLLSDKSDIHTTIRLVNDGKIVTNDSEIATNFNDKFSNVISELDLGSGWISSENTSNLKDPIDIALTKFKNHPSILKIHEHLPNPQTISFKTITEEDIKVIFKSFDVKKGTSFNSVPGKILKEYGGSYYDTVTRIVNDSVSTNSFPTKMKYADINPTIKPGKKDRTDMGSYRPISVLPYASKIFERVLKKQIQQSLTNIFHPHLCGYREGFSAQHALISMLEKWKKSLDDRGFAGAVLMDLSKAFDCVNHELLLAKLDAYGFNRDALKTILDYLSNRWQRTKINATFSSWSELKVGVPQGSVLGPILFNIYLNDLLWTINDSEVCNFADDTTLYACNKELSKVKENLESSSKVAINWFKTNYMKLNEEKCKFIICGKKDHLETVMVGDSQIKEEPWVKLLGIHIDNKLSFDYHISKLVRKANSKITVIKRSFRYLSQFKKKLLLNSFVQSQFSYSPLVWMMHSKQASDKINRVHKNLLRLLYNDSESTFNELLAIDNTFTIHEVNMQKLMTEMFKAKNQIGPSLLQNIFKDPGYKGPELRNGKHFKKPNIQTKKYGEKSLEYFGTLIWNTLPTLIKDSTNIFKFKSLIKLWKSKKCPCYLCKDFVKGIGLVEFCKCTSCHK